MFEDRQRKQEKGLWNQNTHNENKLDHIYIT